MAQSRGIRAAYHNHDFEFKRDSGRHLYTVLLEETDSVLVAMEMDVYWLSKAGEDPLAYFDKHPGRFHLCHLKDMDQKREIRDVGSGVIDFPEDPRSPEAGRLSSFLDRARSSNGRGGIGPVQHPVSEQSALTRGLP